MRPALRRAGLPLALAAAAALLGGCASPAGPQGMVATAPMASFGKQVAGSVTVRTSGGKATGAMDSSNIADADLKAAVERSITESALFRQVLPEGGDYLLSIGVSQLLKPMWGSTFTVEVEMGWTLQRPGGGEPLLRKLVKSSGTATGGDAFVGVTRLRIALERAVQDNIRQGLAAVAAAVP